MSFIRAATLARSAVCFLLPVLLHLPTQSVSQARLYSTEAPVAKKSGVAKYVAPVGGVLGAWLLYEYYFKGDAAEQAKPNKVLTSPLDPQNFVDIKLKRVEPYNHNTSK
jgi:cytochrome-b5 reductase